MDKKVPLSDTEIKLNGYWQKLKHLCDPVTVAWSAKLNRYN